MRTQIEINKLIEECKAEVSRLGFDIKGVMFKMNSRLAKCYGQTYSRLKKIELNTKHCMYDDELYVRDTICHELLHVANHIQNNGKGHDNGWNTLVTSFNKRNKWGLQIKRLGEDNQHSEGYMKSVYKYKVVCTTCGTTYYRSRLCPLVTETGSYSCGCCGNHTLKAEINK